MTPPAQESGWQASDYSCAAGPVHAVSSIDRESGTDTYEYDANGNMTCRIEGGLIFNQIFNAENRLALVQRLDPETPCPTANTEANVLDVAEQWEFAYDGDGNRIKQVNPDDTITLFLGGGIYTVENAAGTPEITKYYSIAGQRVAMRTGTTLQYLLTDHLGSVSAVLDAGGGLVAGSEQRYLPFGGLRLDPGITQTDFAFTGQRALVRADGGGVHAAGYVGGCPRRSSEP